MEEKTVDVPEEQHSAGLVPDWDKSSSPHDLHSRVPMFEGWELGDRALDLSPEKMHPPRYQERWAADEHPPSSVRRLSDTLGQSY